MSKKTISKGPAARKVVKNKSTDSREKRTVLPDPEERSWQSSFVVTEHWISDLKFFDDELRFLRNLIDKYFMWLIEEQNIESTRVIASGLAHLEKQRSALEKKMSEHSGHLANLIKSPFAHNAPKYTNEHDELEKSIAEFTKAFRTVKKEVFKVTEYVMESEKAKHLLGR